VKSLFVAWQDASTQQWAPVGQLTRSDGLFRFVYTRGAEKMSNFHPFGQMDNIHKAYTSTELFPLFANRVLAKNRPEYDQYLGWLGLSASNYDALEELALTGGFRATDSVEIFPCPEPTESKNYEVYFFCRGMQHLHAENHERARELKPGEQLFLMADVQNKMDDKALLMRTDDPVTLVGYAPRYYSAEFSQVLKANSSDQVEVTVDKVNRDAPLQYRVLCKLKSPWPVNFSLCAQGEFELLA